MASLPESAAASVLAPSDPIPSSSILVQGPNFDNEHSLQQLLESYNRIGFQASSFGKAVDIINEMVCPSPQMLVLFL